MATKVKRNERVITLPTKLLEKCNGFSLDFGGSVIKICYLAKKDWENGHKGEEGPLNLTSYSREELDEGLKFLKEHAYVRRTPGGATPVMYTTGFGIHQYAQRIESALDVKLENVMEMDCFALSMENFLDSKPLDEFCVPFEQEISDRCIKETDKNTGMMAKMKEAGQAQWKVYPDETAKKHKRTPDTKTYVIGAFGSGWGSMKGGCFEKMNEYCICNITAFGGRSFLGLGSLLTGAKNYGELMELAEKGNNLNLDLTEKDLSEKTEESKEGGEGDTYAGWAEGGASVRPMLLWGRAVGKNLSDFKREDIARTLLYTMCHHLAITAYDSLVYAKERHLFMGGSFCASPFVQKMVLDEFEHRKFTMAAWVDNVDADYHLHFLKYGSHFGVIGAMIKGAEASGQKDKV